MKKIFIATWFVLVLGLISFVKAQFIQTHYYTGNAALVSDYTAGGVAVDTNNNKWFGTDMGVEKFDGTTWSSFSTSDGLPSDIITCVAVDKNNNIWIGTDGDGVAKYNGTNWTVYTATDGLCDNGIHYIAGDINGDVWFASAGSGVSKLSGTTWTTYTTGLPLDGTAIAAINYITVDAAGNKWFGTSKGISKYNGSTFTTIDQSTVDSLPDNVIYSIAIDAANNKWVGTQYGLTKLNSSNSWVANYRKSNGLYNNFVRDITIDLQGKYWLGLYTDYNNDGGITRFDGTNWVSEQVDYPDSVSADQIFRLAVDKNNDVWVALDYGIIKIDHLSGINENKEAATFSVFPNPASDYINVSYNGQGTMNDQFIEIYNCFQKVKDIYISDNSNKVSIPIKDLVNGLYFVKFRNSISKIIISR